MGSRPFVIYLSVICGIAVACFAGLLAVAGLIAYCVLARRRAEVARAAAVRDRMFCEEKRSLAKYPDTNDARRQCDASGDAEEGRLPPYRDEE